MAYAALCFPFAFPLSMTLMSDTRSDAALLALRPPIPIDAPGSEEGLSAGTFLHATLRPVLKLQNGPLLTVVADFMLDHHMPFSKVSRADQQRMVTELMGRNTKLRYTVIGLVAALFTAEEYAFYRQHRTEVHRRLLDLAQQRVLTQLDALVTLVA
jgi:hypothetical protein